MPDTGKEVAKQMSDLIAQLVDADDRPTELVGFSVTYVEKPIGHLRIALDITDEFGKPIPFIMSAPSCCREHAEAAFIARLAYICLFF